MNTEHLVLAGGGHTHALILLRWGMQPHLRPKGLITLINRNSTLLYSGMLPGLIAGEYSKDDVLIDLRRLSEQAGVSFVMGEIIGLETDNKSISLKGRPSIFYDKLSLDVGSETVDRKGYLLLQQKNSCVSIRPFERAICWISDQDDQGFNSKSPPFTVVGSGLAAIEIVCALRNRWPNRPLRLIAYQSRLNLDFQKILSDLNVQFFFSDESITEPTLLCTGGQAPGWLRSIGLPLDRNNRICTNEYLQIIGHKDIFCVGDCGVIKEHVRQPSGVWAVRATKPLARNLERSSKGLPLVSWRPQKHALQLMAARLYSKGFVAWGFWGSSTIGPYRWLWQMKKFIDRRFINKFKFQINMRDKKEIEEKDQACRGCAAKLGAQPLKEALEKSKLLKLGTRPEDAALIFASEQGQIIIQSVDGFPALLSDPWLNGRLTALHACSDIWASGASVVSAQAIITLPYVSANIQKELLYQCLEGIQSALRPQGAILVGGHTLEARHMPPHPLSLGIQVSLSVNGQLSDQREPWLKSGLSPGDSLLITGPLGVGVLFAASMDGIVKAKDLDEAINYLSKNKYKIMESFFELEDAGVGKIHACTDITGFGLLGHLGEMISATNYIRSQEEKKAVRTQIDLDLIPSFSGALDLLSRGYSSTLASENRKALSLLEGSQDQPPAVEISLGKTCKDKKYMKDQLELLVDPQTCGPLLFSCSKGLSNLIVKRKLAIEIGSVIDI